MNTDMKTLKGKIWLGIWALLLVAVLGKDGGDSEAKSPLKVEHPVVSAFLASGARATNTDLNSWGHINNEFTTSEELHSLARRIAAGFGLTPGAMKVESVEERSFRQLQLAGSLDGRARIIILAQSVTQVSDGQRKLPAETYVVVRILKEGLMEDLASAEDLLKRNIAAVGHDPQIFICIHGVLPGKQSASGRRSLLAGILNSVSAKMLTEISERNLQSITAYSPRIQNKLKVGRLDTNLNVALRYDETGNVTYLAIGSPLIPDEY